MWRYEKIFKYGTKKIKFDFNNGITSCEKKKAFHLEEKLPFSHGLKNEAAAKKNFMIELREMRKNIY